jgi:acyl carrier protein
MPLTTIRERVVSTIDRVVKLDNNRTIRDEDDLYVDLDFDSLEATEFVIELETEFDISISDVESEAMRTVKDACNLVDKLLSVAA